MSRWIRSQWLSFEFAEAWLIQVFANELYHSTQCENSHLTFTMAFWLQRIFLSLSIVFVLYALFFEISYWSFSCFGVLFINLPSIWAWTFKEGYEKTSQAGWVSESVECHAIQERISQSRHQFLGESSGSLSRKSGHWCRIPWCRQNNRPVLAISRRWICARVPFWAHT